MCRGVLKYYGILLGGGGSPQNVHKRSLGGAGLQQKITEDHDHKAEGVAFQKISQTEGAQKETVINGRFMM